MYIHTAFPISTQVKKNVYAFENKNIYFHKRALIYVQKQLNVLVLIDSSVER